MAVISRIDFEKRKARRIWMGRGFHGLCFLPWPYPWECSRFC